MFLEKKYIKKINKKAFSIIEISVVLLIVSVMVAGIATGRSMIIKSRLTNAKSLTQKSIVNEMGDDLIGWFETSLESSFIPSEAKNDNSLITVWKDSNKSAITKNDAKIGVSPTLVQNVFYNSIPGVRFTGTQYLNFDGKKFAKNSYTVFVVEQRSTGESGHYNSFISSPIRAPSKRLSLGYYGSTGILQSHFSNDTLTTVPSYKAQTQAIHTFMYNNTNGQQYTLNGKNPSASNDKTLPLDSYDSANIGYHQGPSQTYYYKGDIAEIIMFKRSLKTEEVEAIESYLGSKYGIPVS
jgi:prepilin-type N-terminal cleavage/methylation domain-containing protein